MAARVPLQSDPPPSPVSDSETPDSGPDAGADGCAAGERGEQAPGTDSLDYSQFPEIHPLLLKAESAEKDPGFITAVKGGAKIGLGDFHPRMSDLLIRNAATIARATGRSPSELHAVRSALIASVIQQRFLLLARASVLASLAALLRDDIGQEEYSKVCFEALDAIPESIKQLVVRDVAIKHGL